MELVQGMVGIRVAASSTLSMLLVSSAHHMATRPVALGLQSELKVICDPSVFSVRKGIPGITGSGYLLPTVTTPGRASNTGANSPNQLFLVCLSLPKKHLDRKSLSAPIEAPMRRDVWPYGGQTTQGACSTWRRRRL
jgi:hypothetical protein